MKLFSLVLSSLLLLSGLSLSAQGSGTPETVSGLAIAFAGADSADEITDLIASAEAAGFTETQIASALGLAQGLLQGEPPADDLEGIANSFVATASNSGAVLASLEAGRDVADQLVQGGTSLDDLTPASLASAITALGDSVPDAFDGGTPPPPPVPVTPAPPEIPSVNERTPIFVPPTPPAPPVSPS
ncbi:MAG: hypothetical protein AAGJ81_09410 [Verrucomicrobiota bacterium]